MIVGPSSIDFYPVEQLCKLTRKHILLLPTEKRYLEKGIWWVHKSCLLDLLRRAKASGNHNTLDFSAVDPQLKAILDNLLNGKRKQIIVPVKKDTPYSVLHLQEDAPRELVDAAFKVLAKLTHPDITKDDGTAFRKVKEAYDIITLRRNVG